MQRLSQLLALLLVLVAMAPARGGAEKPVTTPARYLVFKVQPDGSPRAVFSARVQLRAPLRSRPQSTARSATRNGDTVQVTLQDARRAVIFEDAIEIPRWVRGEFHGEGPGADGAYNIDGHLMPDPAAAFVVRVPDVDGATLTLDSARFPQGARVDLDALDADSTVARGVPAPQPPPLTGWSNGDPANRLDLLIMGDGYTAAQQAQFEADAQDLADNFFSITPYDEYRNYINVLGLFTASAQSGVDQPPYNGSCNQYARVQTCCGDSDAVPTTPTTVATAFNGTFCSFNIQRLVTVDTALVLAAAAAEPDWDEILVLANSSTYGGSGGTIGVISTHPLAVQVAQHEFGHSFMLLADEYASPYPGYPACSDVLSGYPACELNVTDQTSRPLVKWNRWIDAAQPVPSSGPPPVATDAGLWQGARYLASGMYRQGYSCIMQYLGAPFCDVAAEAFPLRLYQGFWGIPYGGIDNIEPGSESPAPGALNAPYPGGTYSATILGPQSGPDVTAEWYVDSVMVDSQPVPSGGTASHALMTAPGLHSVELRVTDNSPIIHSTLRAGLTTSRTWNVTVGPNLCGNSALDAGETCDDANPNGGDGCSAACQVESCWQCSGLPSTCSHDDGAPCSTDPCLSGETCSGGSCTGGVAITTCTDGDGCCPAGCTAGDDLDCGPPTPTPTSTPSPTPTAPPVVAIGAKKLLLKDKNDQTKRKIVFLSQDAQIDSGGINPVANGATLQVYNANGSGESLCLTLPSGNWEGSGTSGYIYKDPGYTHGPCKVVAVRAGKLLKAVCHAKVQPIAYSLNESAQGAMAVRFTSGSTTWCARFGGTVRADSGTNPPVAGGKGKFLAKDAGAASCPAAPVSCP